MQTMTIGPGTRSASDRKYAYGVVKRAILVALGDREPHTVREILVACPLIDPVVLRRNLGCMRSLGEIKNVGTKKEARYVWHG